MESNGNGDIAVSSGNGKRACWIIVTVAVAAIVALNCWASWEALSVMAHQQSSDSPVVGQLPAVGAVPVTAAPYIEPPSQSPPVFLQPYIKEYEDEYEQTLGTPGADWIVGDMIAHPDASGYTLPVGDMTNWPNSVEIVAGATSFERAQSERSAHGYATCDIQQGGTTTYVGQRGWMSLMQYRAPTDDSTITEETSCTGGEYFFISPEQLSRILAEPFV